MAKEDDRVLVYFAGHGFVAAGQAVPGALRHRAGPDREDGLSDGDARVGLRQDQGEVEGAADGFLPQRGGGARTPTSRPSTGR